MKKILLNAAAAAMVILPALSASADELKVETLWGNLVTNKVANPVPNLEGGWGGKATPEKNYCSRFGVGHGGKIYTTSHKDNAIVAISEGNKVEKVFNVGAVANTRWNGTAISIDEAGNFIINYGFTDATVSLQQWAIIDKNGKLTPLTLSTPLNTLTGWNNNRLDIIGQVVGDVTSEKGAIAYATLGGKYKRVVMFHFKGNGTVATSVTAKVCSNDLLALTDPYQGGGFEVVAPKYLTIDEILATPNPEDQFLLSTGRLGLTGGGDTPVFPAGFLGKYEDTSWAPAYNYGNRGYGWCATFKLGGKQYIVRNYIDENGALYKNTKNAAGDPVYSGWQNVMNYAIYDMNGAICAQWQESGFSSTYGMGKFSVEPIDVNSVYVYVYACTGSTSNGDGSGANADNGTKTGAYCAVTKVSLANPIPVAKPGESAENPILIATAEDLCNAYKNVTLGSEVYFKQTADIDMKGIESYTAINGYAGGWETSPNVYKYNAMIHYDGDNHVIKNFAPKNRIAGTDANAYYCTSVFGVLAGSVKNLGIVDVNIEAKQGQGILAAYAGHQDVPDGKGTCTIENVFVSGTMSGTGYTGGFFGTNATATTIKNCYSQVTITGTPTFAGLFIGRARNKGQISVSNSYAAGSVPEGAGNGFLFGTDKNAGNVTVKLADVVAFSTGVLAAKEIIEESEAEEGYIKNLTAAAPGDAAAIKVIQGWAAFNEGKIYNNYPALNWQDIEPVAEQDGSEAHPYLIATAEDLCNAYTKMVDKKVTYFKQTADIDMAGVENYTTFNGFDGTYGRSVNYDGDNHVIKNFAPVDRIAGVGENAYYCTSLFGVVSGTIKNLGVVNAKSECKWGEAGILGSWGGFNNDVPTVVENVFVQGEISNVPSGPTGGIFGTTGGKPITFTNCYAQVSVTGSADAAAFIGSSATNVTIENSYAVATVKGGANSKSALLLGGYPSGKPAKLANVIVFGTGEWAIEDYRLDSEDANTVTATSVVAPGDAAAIKTIQGWAAFNNGKLFNNYPALNWQNLSGVNSIFDDEEVDADAPVVYYNLNGVQVANPERGIYIKKQGSKVSKVVIR